MTEHGTKKSSHLELGTFSNCLPQQVCQSQS